MINIFSFVLGLAAALIIITIIVLVVAVVKMNKKLGAFKDNVTGFFTQFQEVYQQIDRQDRELRITIEECLRNSKSYTDSRIDKLSVINNSTVIKN